MTEQCIECNEELDKENMIYVCSECDKGFHDECKEQHVKKEHLDTLYLVSDTECPYCSDSATELYSCSKCDFSGCENCKEEHIDEHLDDMFQEFEYSEYIAEKL